MCRAKHILHIHVTLLRGAKWRDRYSGQEQNVYCKQSAGSNVCYAKLGLHSAQSYLIVPFT